jgi:hypothetical protein
MHRQLQWLWTFRIKIGMDVSSDASWTGREDATPSSCSRGTTHSLSAHTKIASQDLFGIG